MYRENVVHTNTVYRHFKGKFYYVIAIAEHTETFEDLVIYHGLYGEGETYARPLGFFLSEVPEESQKDNVTGQKYRFEEMRNLHANHFK